MAIRLSKLQFEADQAARKAKKSKCVVELALNSVLTYLYLLVEELQALISELEIEFNYEFTRE